MKIHTLIMALIISVMTNMSAANVLVNADFENFQGKLPANWVYFAKNNYGVQDSSTAAAGSKSVKISVPTGKDTICGFGQMGLKTVIPADTPIQLSGWSKCKDIVTTKKSAVRISATVIFDDGGKGYLALSFPRSENWEYREKIYKFPKKIVEIKNLYLQFYNASGTIWYDDIFLGAVPAQKGRKNPEAMIPVTSQPPVLDGKLNDPCWKTSAVLSGFTIFNKDKFPENKTEALVCIDRKNLYIGLRCDEKILDPVLQMRQKFKASEKKHDGSVFKDDSIEIFIDPGKGSYYQFAFNALGTRYDGRKLDKNWNSDWQAACSVNEKSWDAEVAIPLKDLDLSFSDNLEFGFNICRNEKAFGETSTWARLTQGFHDPDGFGLLKAGSSILQVIPQKLLSSPIDLGRKQLSFTVNNPSSKASEAKLTVVVADGKQTKNYQTAIKLAPNADVSQIINIDIEDAGKYNYCYELSAPGKTYYRSPVYALDSNVILEAENNLSSTGQLKVTVNGKQVGKNFFLQQGRNDIVVECTPEAAQVNGFIMIKGNDKYGSEKLSLDSNWLSSVKGNTKSFQLRLETGLTSTGPIDTDDGLHVNRGAFQALPFTIFNPEEAKILEIMLPETLSLVDFADRDIADVNIRAGKQGSTIIDGQKYDKYSATIKSSRLKNKTYYYGTLLHLPAKITADNLFIYYRLKGTGTAGNQLEVWNRRKIVPMPELKAARPAKLQIQVWHAFTGRYSQAQLNKMFKTFADAGFNTYIERFLCYSVDDCLNPLKNNKFRIISELNPRGLMARAYRNQTTKAKNFAGKEPSYVKYPITFICGEGRQALLDEIMEFARKYPVDGYIFDMEYNPFRECDTSEISRKAFADFAGLDKVPSKEEIKQHYSAQWIDFMCREWACVGGILKDGIKQVDSKRLFINYSAYQKPQNKEHYAIDWTQWRNVIDGAGMGYGRQSEDVRNATFKALGNIPAYTGVLYDAAMPVNYYKNLKTRILRRITDGAKGITLFTWVRLEGRALEKINEACAILAGFEDFFIKNEKVDCFKTSGGIGREDVVMLKNDNAYLLVVFNERKTRKNGTIELELPYTPEITSFPDGRTFKTKSLKISVQSDDIAVYYLKKQL